MDFRVLGCSGGIGGSAFRTTSFLIDDDVLIDAGTGVADLDIAALARIDHVFLTHSHLDHVACLPFMVDTVGQLRARPLTVHADAPTRAALERHVFNDVIWPDFTRIPAPETAYLRFATFALGDTITLGTRRFTVLPALHTVPAVGFQIDSGAHSLVFTGDTTLGNDAFWNVVNRIDNLRHLVIETAFPETERWLAELSRHLSPAMLAQELTQLERDVSVHVTHLKPSQHAATATEIADHARRFSPQLLRNGDVIHF